MRFKGIHYVNEPVVFDMIFAVIRPFMKQKILDRVSILILNLYIHTMYMYIGKYTGRLELAFVDRVAAI